MERLERTGVLATLNFMTQQALYTSEKPYNINYRVVGWDGDVSRSNYRSENVEGIWIEDLRGRENLFNFETHGFAIIDLKSSLAYADYNDRQKIDDVYCQELAACLIEYLDAAAVHIFDVEIRRRHSQFPHIDMHEGMEVQPAARVHIDGSRRAFYLLLDELGGKACEYKRHLFLNVWRPLRGPVFDWPLAICDPNTINASADLETNDIVYEDVVRENIMVHQTCRQKWYYLSAQMPSELLIFRQADSEGNTGVPHTAFQLPTDIANANAFPRESIEARVIACFD